MLIGAMNHPRHDVIEEIHWIAEAGMEFVDLTLEPPAAASWRVSGRDIRQALEQLNMFAVGHTAYYLPLASPFDDVRQACVDELRRCMHVFAEVGVKWMNVHPDRPAPMHDRACCIEKNLETLRGLMPLSQQLDVGLMIENLPDGFNSVQQLGELLDSMPELGLHLDIGHCNLRVPVNTSEDLLRAYGHRLKHVHLHDNNGGYADLHLPLGAGTMDMQRYVKALKRSGYDGTITLEVFSEDTHYLLHSAKLLRNMWDEA